MILRELEIKDAAAYFESVDANREHLSQFDDRTALKYPTLSSVEDSIENPDNPEKLRFGIWDNSNFVGTINITPDVDSAEIGYWIDKRFIGNGYATIATRALSVYISDKFSTVFAEVKNGNEASCKVLERSGYLRVNQNNTKIIYEFNKSSFLDEK